MEQLLLISLLVALFYVGLCMITGAIARDKGRSFIGFTLLSMGLPPFFGFIIVLGISKDHIEVVYLLYKSINQATIAIFIGSIPNF